MADKLIFIPNDDKHKYPFCRLQLAVEIFGHSTLKTNKSEFNKSSKGLTPIKNITLL